MRVIADFVGQSLPAEEPTASLDGDGDEHALALARLSTAQGAVTRIYQANAEFVWRSLQRLGVRAPDLDDVLQEVFVVVHQRLQMFDGSSKMTTWLFGICLRVASAYRRRGFRRNETSVAEPPEPNDGVSVTPEEDLAAAESRRRLDLLLDELEVEKRAVFVMFEIDEMPCEEIAQILGVPLGTVYSRLHAARKSFQKALARMQARESRAQGWLR